MKTWFRPQFSLLHLMSATVIVAVVFGVVLYRQRRVRDEMLRIRAEELNAIAEAMGCPKDTRQVDIHRRWIETIDNRSPFERFISDEATWVSVWDSTDALGKLPNVDFGRSVIVVAEQDAADPNEVSYCIGVDDDGHVSVGGWRTLIAYRSSNKTRLTFLEIARDGVVGMVAD